MTLLVPNEIENETPADAVEVDQNFKVTQQYINANAIIRNGSVAMQAPLQLFGDPISDDDAVRKAYVDALLPVGVILPYAGITVPAGAWAFCNGASAQTAVYPELFQVCQYRFGGSGGSFNLPDMRARTMIGLDSRETRFDTAGDKGGTWKVPIPYHRHQIDHDHPAKTTGYNNVGHVHPMTHDHADSDINMRSGEGGAALQPQQGQGAFTNNYMIINTPTFTGNTGSQSANHYHSLDLSLIDAWSSYEGTQNVEHLPPYLVVSFVIRVG